MVEASEREFQIGMGWAKWEFERRIFTNRESRMWSLGKTEFALAPVAAVQGPVLDRLGDMGYRDRGRGLKVRDGASHF